VNLFDELRDRGAQENAIGEAGGTADRRLRATAHEDRDPGRWCRPHGERRQIVDRAVVGEWLAGPGLRQDLEDLLHRRAPTTSVGAEAGELHLVPTKPEAQDQPAMAKQLDGRGVLSQAQRVVERGEDYAGAELDP
jgi:hypothetical protein